MKPFDLEQAKAGKPLTNVDGENVVFGCHNPSAKAGCKLICFIEGEARTFREDGQYFSDRQSKYDLFMKVEKKTVFINIFSNDGRWVVQAGVFATKESAESRADPKAKYPWVAIAVPIEIEV